MSGEPYSKSRQLARGERRYRRKVASPKQWQAIVAAKMGPCRVCSQLWPGALIDPHHLVFHEHGGDDVAENVVPLCRACHEALHNRAQPIARLLLSRLSDAEYAYMVERGGEDYAERVYGVEYERWTTPSAPGDDRGRATDAEVRDPFADDVLERLVRSNQDYQREHGNYIVPLSERLLAARAEVARLNARLVNVAEAWFAFRQSDLDALLHEYRGDDVPF